MNQDWNSFLEQYDAGEQSKSEREGFVTSLDHLSLLEVRGEDAKDFLSGQFSNDINALPQGQWQTNAYCNPKGRAIAIMRVIHTADQRYWLLTHHSMVGALIKRLRMYVLRAKVIIEIVDQIVLGVVAPADDNFSEFEKLPANKGSAAKLENGICITLGGTPKRWIVIAQLENAKALWTAFRKRLQPAHEANWIRHDITTGWPQVTAQTSEMFIPQQLNLDLIDGISFTKGCYPGQEIIARIKYRGRVKQRMFITTIETESVPEPGTAIYAADGNKQSLGNLVSATQSDQKNVIALAVLPVANAETELHLGSQDGSRLTVHTDQLELFEPEKS